MRCTPVGIRGSKVISIGLIVDSANPQLRMPKRPRDQAGRTSPEAKIVAGYLTRR